ncbi:ubiquitin-associated (UBA)/TS-N domain-containing protein [Artemisia annua]|uniref:Ubiquitin-associated (UBA)/TS-N domain-containing protein n=1 Tax=Artemisia annua TaxID=35608 RepID=A0A2U1Q2Q4_ARTAN|nr:ubiquitin-associated (UBA)/TS-N domain-containing protein [Artemisia annua]
MSTAKLKIAGAWSGILEADLNEWTIPFLKQQILTKIDNNCSSSSSNNNNNGSINLICAGKVLKDDDDGTHQKKLVEFGVKNNSKILVTRVSPDHGKELVAEEEKTNRLQRLKAAATSLATRHADGSLPLEDFNLELENQSGEKVQLGSENDQRALMMGLMFHGKAKQLVKKKMYEDAVEVLAMGEESFSLCDSKVVELIDNVPILQIDMVWCYFMLKDISKLSVAGKRLEDARKGIERSHGKESTRLRLLHGNSHPELALHLRLELLEAIVAYHSGNIEKAKISLNSARSRYLQLQVPDEALSMLMGMGYGQKAAKRALRMNRQDVERAVNFLIEEKAKKQQKLEDDIRRRNEIMEQKKFGVTPLKKAVDLQKLKELVSYGFEKELAAESLRRNENETQRALDDLTNPETNSDIQLFIESKKKKRLRQAADATIERLTSLGFPRDSVVAAVRAYGTEELALNHLLEQNQTNANQELTAPVADNVTAPVADNVGSSSGVGEGSSSAANETTQNGDLSGFEEMQRDVEMEDELTEDLQSEDAFSDYDMELTRESEAIDEYLALVSV